MDTSKELVQEAKRLFDLGMGVHWIKCRSKAPVESGWADGSRQGWQALTESFRSGFGLGVRLGKASQFPDGSYLANLDVDIKSEDPRHRAEALKCAEGIYPGITRSAPSVITGYGVRYFFRTKEPLQSRRLGGSTDRAKVFMPTAPVSAEQQKARDCGFLTDADLKAGWRARGAWEVEVMSAGKQVVLPPSIHPDTNLPYKWGRPLSSWEEMPVYAAPAGAAVNTDRLKNKDPLDFEPVEVAYFDSRFPDHTLRLIFGEVDVGDRSAAAFSVAISMVKSGFSDAEILTVLTDRDTFLGETAYDHRGTKNRQNAARWAFEYCLRKAKLEADAAAAFRDVAVVTKTLDEDAAADQLAELVEERPWRSRLRRAGKDGDGPVKPTLENTLLILENAVSPEVFKRDMFAGRDAYGAPAPWTGAAVGKAITDDDAVAILEWLGKTWGFEPSIGTVFSAMTAIALRNSYHPVQIELRALPAWDGKSRIDGWLAKYFGAEGPVDYLAQVFRKWLVASVTRTFEPGAKFDWMPIFEGLQGTGKSSFGAILFGQRYFADWLPNLADKDAALGLAGRRCIEFGELDRLRRNEVETIKAFVTRQVDVVRPPYGRKSVEFERGCVFFGTTNREEYLQDDTGNRRFMPVRVGRLNFDALRRDRDQLWAEALCLYDLGLVTTLDLEGAAVGDAVEIQKTKMVKDESEVMAELITDWAVKNRDKPKSEQFDFSKFRLHALFNSMGPLGNYRLEAKNLRFAGKALKSLGGDGWKSHGNKAWKLDTSAFGGPWGP